MTSVQQRIQEINKQYSPQQPIQRNFNLPQITPNQFVTVTQQPIQRISILPPKTPNKIVALAPQTHYLQRLEALADKLLSTQCNSKYATKQIYKNNCDIVALGMKIKVTSILTTQTYGNINKKLLTIDAKKKFVNDGLNIFSKLAGKNGNIYLEILKNSNINVIDNEHLFNEKMLYIINNKDMNETIFRLLSILGKHTNTLQPIFIELIIELCFNIINDNGNNGNNIYYDNIQYGGGLTNILKGIGGVTAVFFGYLLCCTIFMLGPGIELRELGNNLLDNNLLDIDPCEKTSSGLSWRCR